MSLYLAFQKVISSFGMEDVTHPIFYNTPIGIRFNIGDNGNGVNTFNSDYEAYCLERSLRIYNSLEFCPDLLVVDGYLNESDTPKDFISSVLSATDLPYPNEIKQKIVHNEDDVLIHVYLLWNFNGFKPNKILEEIIKADLGKGNCLLISSVYFVCTNDNILFHLYDTRGADLVADKKEKIQHVYQKLNDLILDHDRERIDSIFY